jgi:hypothetical protein
MSILFYKKSIFLLHLFCRLITLLGGIGAAVAELIVGHVNFNDLNVVALFEKVIQAALDRSATYFPLRFKPRFYFSAPPGTVFPSEGGWYIILAGRTPVYVGQADDLNSRLNSNQGSLDNFAKKDRTSDAERNFVKRFAEIGRVPDLRVCLITRAALASGLDIPGRPFGKVDVDNIEKVLNILRGTFRYQ